ncbi:hypothetical protein Ciccas_001357 [Cichlidogyrus casuarinus]|uniref:DNA polymerase delta subunit 3 n=1 Tax=Cichlidogyrus casuarinus TaxID=1844966 RepID=A0ABD2QKE0_9PLAT
MLLDSSQPAGFVSKTTSVDWNPICSDVALQEQKVNKPTAQIQSEKPGTSPLLPTSVHAGSKVDKDNDSPKENKTVKRASDDEVSPVKRKKKVRIFESDSESEDEKQQQKSPPKKKQPAKRESVKRKAEKEVSSCMPAKKVKASPVKEQIELEAEQEADEANCSTRLKRLTKTTTDSEGFLVSESVLQTVTEDVQPVAVKPTNQQQVKSKDIVQKRAFSKKDASNKKQASLTSFFKKL